MSDIQEALPARLIQLATGVVHLNQGFVLRDGRQHKLTTKECALLLYLSERPGQLITRDDILVDVWGYQPDVVTRAVDTTMSRLRAKVEHDPAQPRHLITVFGEGYRFEPEVSHSTGGSIGLGGLSAASVGEKSAFVGRSQEFAQVKTYLEHGVRLITLLGTGGVGKTRLAVELMRCSDESISGDAWMCDLSAVVDQAGIVRVVAQALGVSLNSDTPVFQLGHALAALGPGLVVLDNFEQLIAHAGPTVGHWLRMAPDLRFVCTSRVRLDLAAERVIEIGPLPMDEALTLFLQHGRALCPSLHLSGPTGVVIERIVTMLDRLPLALVLAAARLSVLSPEDLLGQLGDRFSMLRSRDVTVPDRHATLQATIDWSWDLLPRHTQEAMAQCSVFEGGFSLGAAEAVLCLADESASPWVVDVIQDLLESGLLWTGTTPGNRNRYQMFESVHAHAKARLQAMGADCQAAAFHRHALHYAALAVSVSCEGLRMAKDQAARRRQVVEIDNLVVAIQRSLLAKKTDLAAQAARGANDVLLFTGPYTQVVDLSQPLLALADLTPESRVHLLYDVAAAHLQCGRHTDAAGVLEQATERAKSLQATDLVCQLAVLSARVKQSTGDLHSALLLIEHPVRTHREQHQNALLALALHCKGRIEYDLGQISNAAESLRGALALMRQQGNTIDEPEVLGLLANVESCAGRKSVARGLFRAGIELARENGDKWNEAYLLMNNGILELEMGRYEDALQQLNGALVIHQKMGAQRGVAKVLTNLGVLAMSQGDLSMAQTHLEDALALCSFIGDSVTETILISNLSSVLARTGDLPGAMAAAVKALELKRKIGDPIGIGIAHGNLGDLLMLQGDLVAAKTNLEIAIEQCADLKQAAGAFLGSMGWLCAQIGEHEQAEQHFQEGVAALKGVYLAEYAQLLCKWGLAALLGDKKDAQLHLTAARNHYVQLGAHPESELAVLLNQLESAVSDASL